MYLDGLSCESCDLQLIQFPVDGPYGPEDLLTEQKKKDPDKKWNGTARLNSGHFCTFAEDVMNITILI